MRLLDLIKGVSCEVWGDENIDVSRLFHNSKEVQNGGVFFAIDGTNESGEKYISEAIKNGAKVVVCNQNSSCYGITKVITEDVRLAMSLMANNFYQEPSKSMFIVGITGTNGKTTSTYMLESIYKQSGAKVGVIGTNGIVINGKKYPSEMTTPDPILLQKTLAKMRDEGVDVVVMEVSAHALELQKIRGVMTDIASFTNLTQDHLDFFKTMQNYGQAKLSFFTENYARYGVVNLDDEFGKFIFEKTKIPTLTYSRNVENSKIADIIVRSEKHNITNQEIFVSTPKGSLIFNLNLMGGFNVSNALGAIAVAIMSGVSLDDIKIGLESLEKVDGRFNTYNINGVRVIIDYAHTPDGLENVLRATREITDGKVFSVFGCGGNRDATKRPIMGRISGENADYTIITSDNPRFENPKEIARQIEAGIVNEYEVCLDRKKAIIRAIELAKQGDSVVIAGKGAEDYLDVEGNKIPYSDKGVVEEIIANLEMK